MTVDEELVGRVRAALGERGVEFTEKQMFGSLVFMVEDAIALGVRGSGGLLVRCAPEESDALLARDGARIARMGERSMGEGWLDVDVSALAPDEAVNDWVEVALRRQAG